MNKIEKQAIRRCLKSTKNPSVSGPSYDENFKETSSGDDPKLLEDPKYKAGYAKCYNCFEMYLNFIINDSTTSADLKKFVGLEIDLPKKM